MLPADMEAALAPDQTWKRAYAAVETAARAHLDALPGTQFSTAALVAALYPGDNKQTTARIFKALAALEDHGLAAYVARGPMERIGPIAGRRRIWSKPDGAAQPQHVCPACRRPL